MAKDKKNAAAPAADENKAPEAAKETKATKTPEAKAPEVTKEVKAPEAAKTTEKYPVRLKNGKFKTSDGSIYSDYYKAVSREEILVKTQK